MEIVMLLLGLAIGFVVGRIVVTSRCDDAIVSSLDAIDRVFDEAEELMSEMKRSRRPRPYGDDF